MLNGGKIFLETNSKDINLNKNEISKFAKEKEVAMEKINAEERILFLTKEHEKKRGNDRNI